MNRFIQFIAVFSAVLLTSCEINHYKATAANGNTVEESNYQIAGTRSSRRADGSSSTNQYGPSWRDTMTAATALGGKISTNNADVAQTKSDNGVLNNANSRQPTIVPPVQTAPGTTVFPQVIPPPPAALPK